MYIKDLRIFEDQWDTKDIVLIDNAAHSFALQINNGVPILPFYDNKLDVEMIYLSHYLTRLAKEPDLRILLEQTFWLEKLHSPLICDIIGGIIEYTVEELDDFEYQKLQET